MADNWDEAKTFVESKFLQFDEQGLIEAEFVGFDQELNPFSTGESDKMRLVLHLKCDDGIVRDLQTGSKRLIGKLIKVSPKAGDRIRIMREGEGFQTQYL